MKKAHITDRGELGIGALIIFVSLIVVAAIIGTVILNIAIAYGNNVSHTESSAYEYSIGCFEISKIYGIRGFNGHFYSGLIGLLIDAKLAPTIHNANLKYIAITIKMNDDVRRYTLSPNVSISDTYQTAILKATNKTYAVYLAYRSQDSPWDPEKGSYEVNNKDVVEFIVLANKIESNFSFVFPYFDPDTGVSSTDNLLIFNIYSNDTTINIDVNHDGHPEYIISGNRGDTKVFNLNGISGIQGASISSNYPVNIAYRHNSADYGTYEDGSYRYTLLPYEDWGTTYFVPIAQKWVIITSATNNNVVSVDTNGDNVPDLSNTLNSGQTWKLSNVPSGSKIWASNKIMVVEVNEDHDYYDNTSAFTLLPINEVGSEYFVPAEHNYKYDNSVDYTKVYLLSTHDNTRIYIDTNNDGTPEHSLVMNSGELRYYSHPVKGARIYANYPFYAIYKFDVYGQDPWAGVMRHYVYTYSLLPSSFGISKAYLHIGGKNSGHVPSGYSSDSISVISLANGNTIKMDYQLDGTWDRTDNANHGDVVTYGPEYSGSSDCEIMGTKKFLVYKSTMGWWDQISENTGANLEIPSLGGASSITGVKILAHPSDVLAVYIQNTINSGERFAIINVPSSFESNEAIVLIYSSGY